MNAKNTRHDDSHDKSWELLPWLANRTLDEWSSRLVEEHARDCVACRKELELLRGVGESMRATDDQPLSPQGSLSVLMGRIDREEDARAAAATGWLADLFERFDLSGRTIHVAQAAAILVLVVAVGWFWVVGQEPRFRTLSTTTEVAADSVPRIRVVFDDHLSVAEMGEILAEIGGGVVDGPSPHGVYTVEIVPVDSASADISALIDQLREREGVRFAEPHGPPPERRP